MRHATLLMKHRTERVRIMNVVHRWGRAGEKRIINGEYNCIIQFQNIVYFFFPSCIFFSGSSIVGGFWNLDQLRHFSGKCLKNRLGKKIQPSEKKKCRFFQILVTKGKQYFQRKKNKEEKSFQKKSRRESSYQQQWFRAVNFSNTFVCL